MDDDKVWLALKLIAAGHLVQEIRVFLESDFEHEEASKLINQADRSLAAIFERTELEKALQDFYSTRYSTYPVKRTEKCDKCGKTVLQDG